MNLIQNQTITVPATTGEITYKNLFSSDKNCQYVTGIAAIQVSGDFSQNIEIEFTDDVNSIFAMSPAQNWVKDTASDSWDITKIFRLVNLTAKGRNYYCNVKAKNTTSAVTFVVYYYQSDEKSKVIPYNFQTYEFNNSGAATQYLNVVLPTDFKKVKGVAIYSNATKADLSQYFLRVVNSYKNLVDDMQLSGLQASDKINYDNSFYLCNFDTEGQDIKVYTSLVDSSLTGTAFTFKVVFLLTN